MPTRTFTLKIPIQVVGAGPAKTAISGVANAASGSASAHAKAGSAAVAHGRNLNTLAGNARGAGASIGGLKSILAGLGLGAFAREVLQAGIKMEQVGSAMRFATGSAQGAKIEIAFLKEETKRLGLEFSSSAERYSKLSAALKGTGVDVREIFTAVGEASAVLGLSADQTERSFYALEQMAGKGVVSMEELRRQLGENLVGAFSIAARAMKMSVGEFNQFVASGKLLAQDFLPKFAAQLRKEVAEELPNSLDKTVQSMNRMKNSIFTFFSELSQKVGPAVKGVMRDISNAFDSIDTDALGRDLSSAIEAVGTAIRFVAENADKLLPILKGLIALNVARWAITTATALSTAASKLNIFATVIGTATAGLSMFLGKVRKDGNAMFDPWVKGATAAADAMEETGTKLLTLGDKAPAALRKQFEAQRAEMLKQMKDLDRMIVTVETNMLQNESNPALVKKLMPWLDDVKEKSAALKERWRDLAFMLDEEVVPSLENTEVALDKVSEKIKEQNKELELVLKTMRTGGDFELIEDLLKQGLTVDEIKKATGAKYENARANYELKQIIDAVKESIKDEAEALKEATKGMKEFNEEIDKNLDAQGELKKSIATEDAKRFLDLMKVARYGGAGVDADALAKIEEERKSYEKWAKVIEAEFGPEGAQRIMADFRDRTREAMDIKKPGEMFVEVAETMADAIQTAFGDAGSEAADFLNKIVQLIAVIQQMKELAKSINFQFGGGGISDAGGIAGQGGGFWSNVMSFFGGGGQDPNMVGPPNFRSAGARFGRIGSGALTGLGIGTAVGGIAGTFGFGNPKKDYSQEGGAVGGAIGGIIGSAVPGIGTVVGSVVGGALGTVVGSLIKKGADEALGVIDSTGNFNMTKAEGEAGKALAEVGEAVARGISDFAKLIDGEMLKTAGVEMKFRDGVYSVFGGFSNGTFNPEAFRTEDPGEAVAEALLRSIRGADWSGVSENIQKAIASPLSDSMENLQRNVQVAMNIDKLGVSEFASGIKETIANLNDLKEAGIELGMDISKVDEEISRVLKDAADDYSGSLLGFLEEYYEGAQVGEEMKRSLEQANFQIRLAQLNVEFQTLVALNAFTAEQLAMVQGALDYVNNNAPTFSGDRERRQQGQTDRQNRRQKRADELEAAFDTLAGSFTALRDEFKAYSDAIAVLDDRLKRGAISQDQYNNAIAEFRAEMELAFGENLLDFIDNYYGDVEGHEQLRMNMAQARFDLEIGLLKAQFIMLKQLGVLSEETIRLVDDTFKWIDEHPPNLGPDRDAADDDADALLDVWQKLMKDMAEAAENSLAQATTTILGIIDSIYGMLPNGTKVRGVTITGGQPTGQFRTVNHDNGMQSLEPDLEPLRVVLGEMMDVEEARFNLNKAMQLIQLEVYKAQLHAAGIFNFDEMIDGAAAIVRASTYLGDTVTDAANEMRDAAIELGNQIHESYTNFHDAWAALTAEDETEAQRIQAKYDELERLFGAQAVGGPGGTGHGNMIQFLRDQNAVTNVTKDAFGRFFGDFGDEKGVELTLSKVMEIFRSIIEPLEQAEIADAIEDVADALQPIRDYFEDLRLSAANLTTQQQYENTLAEFNEAFAAGDIDRAVEMARLLTGEVGIAQFGTSGQAYQDLQDFLVSTLGSLLPEGPPPDLMSQSVAFQERSTIALEAHLERAHLDADRVVAAIEANTAVRRTEAGRV